MQQPKAIDGRFLRLLNHLGRGGAYQYWCSFNRKVDPAIRDWVEHWEVGKPTTRNPADIRQQQNVYFPVHPLKGKPRKGRGERDDVAAINCLFAEFDCSDGKEAAAATMAALLRAVHKLTPPPTFVVNSGGGFHCYWLLNDPLLLARPEDVQRAQAVQRAWVRLVGGEQDATDLARVLRVPGTSNVKPFRDNGAPREVRIALTRWDALYEFEHLASLVELQEHDYRGFEAPDHPNHEAGQDEPPPPAIAPLMAQLEQELRHHGPGVDYHAYARAGLDAEVEKVRHKTTDRNNQLNASAYTMGRKVARGWIDEQTVTDALTQAALFAGLEVGEVQPTIRSGLQKGMLNPAPDPKPRPPQGLQGRAFGRMTITARLDPEDGAEEEHEVREEQAAFHHLTDLGNARRLVERYGEHLRYVPTWGKWLIYQGGRWRTDDLNQVHRHAQGVVRELHAKAGALDRQVALLTAGEPGEKQLKEAATLATDAKVITKWAIASESRDRLNAMVQVAQHDDRVATSHHAFDADPFLLAVANGVVDLKTGRLLDHQPHYLLRSGSDVVYNPDAMCPTWISFLRWATGNDPQLQTYLQRIVGYTLTGDVSEQCYFFLYGPGGNGKSTFVNVVAQLLGDLFAKAPIDMVLSIANTQIPNDLARLPGKRMTSLGEMKTTRHGPMRFDEAKIKDLTGGDTITARLLHQEWFDFKPQFKLWIYGNHKPEIRGDDAGLARRTRLVPFLARVEEGMKDRHFEAKLKRELSGILNWAITGCLHWQSEGLTLPEVVADATAEYLQTQDPIGVWIAEECTTGPGHVCGTRKLYRAYRPWCEQVGEEPVSEKAFATSLDNKGFTRRRGMDGSLRLGIVLKSKEEKEAERE